MNTGLTQGSRHGFCMRVITHEQYGFYAIINKSPVIDAKSLKYS